MADEHGGMASFIGLQSMDRRITEVEERLSKQATVQIDQVRDSLHVAAMEQRTAVEAVDAHLREVFEGIQAQIDRRLQELDRRTAEGDHRLTEHIAQQITQIEATVTAQKDRVSLALEAAESLELKRLDEVQLRIESVRREVTLIQEAAAAAIEKAEIANEKRFESVNEFRAQLGDQVAQFLPRETFDAQLAAWTQWRTSVDARLNQQHGVERVEQRQEQKALTWQVWVAGAVVTAIVAVLIFVANLLTGIPAQ